LALKASRTLPNEESMVLILMLDSFSISLLRNHPAYTFCAVSSTGYPPFT
jgi:hypothetical protein